MITSDSMPISAAGTQSRTIPNSALIDRMAKEMRATGDRELPLSFYAEQAKRKLATEAAANDDKADPGSHPAAATSSVFHCWAMPEHS